MFYFPRGGNRGGSDQFKWDDVKTDKHREFYLGHSVKAPVGRWQEGKDLTWYAKDKKDEQSTLKKEFNYVKNAEKEAMMIALGQIPPKSSNGESSINKKCDEPQQEHKLKKSSSKNKQSSKKKKKKKSKKERRETSDSAEEEEKKLKRKKRHKHRNDDSSESEEESKVKKRKYSEHVKSKKSKPKYEHKIKNKDIRDRNNEQRGKHRAIEREYKSGSDEYASTSSEREFKRLKKRRKHEEKRNYKY